MLKSLVLFAVAAAISAQRDLILPDARACANRVKHAHEFRNGHHYFYSWRHRATARHERDWLDGRNICRKHCQDLVSLETAEEARMIESAVARDGVKYIWTSGRKCDFDGCDRPDLQPLIINGFFWSGSGEKMPPTNQRITNGFPNWSHTGGSGRPQPDNREEAEGTGQESCVGILNNFYDDGVKWHDIACHHQKPWVCEDSDELLAYARSTSRLRIP
ncbi:L-selectin-like [Pollicipes pollicipes]|uniref:L-selectin-like n=1 Tax=Pollicipes pollicipes TaxID=41117 RepID=UPI0018859106|nr:L-selectin-like [Pollicipes pollicipes]XP_037090551.1 L-selectin-like [Pollicipes pollicipes]